MKKANTLLAIMVLGLTGCAGSDNYTPPETASGEDIFNLNCTKCHKPETGAVMRLTAGATKESIIAKIHKGGMTMPAFPNIKGEPAERLADYILANSKPK